MDRPPGVDIAEELEGYYDREIHHGRLYPNLDTLVGKGLIDQGERDRRTNYHTLSRRGRRELESRQEWEREQVNDAEVSA